jgi:hypothetical protein
VLAAGRGRLIDLRQPLTMFREDGGVLRVGGQVVPFLRIVQYDDNPGWRAIALVAGACSVEVKAGGSPFARLMRREGR